MLTRVITAEKERFYEILCTYFEHFLVPTQNSLVCTVIKTPQFFMPFFCLFYLHNFSMTNVLIARYDLLFREAAKKLNWFFKVRFLELFCYWPIKNMQT